MPDLEQARLLLELATRDLQALRHMLPPAAFADEIFGFHAQQACEKAFKAWLCLLGATYPLTHDLRLLCVLVEERGASAATRFENLVALSDFAVQYRYGFSAEEPLDRSAVLRQVEQLVNFVLAQTQHA
jgi:HEPN domain-containing protein